MSGLNYQKIGLDEKFKLALGFIKDKTMMFRHHPNMEALA